MTEREPRDRRTPVVIVTGASGRPEPAAGAVANALSQASGTVLVRHDLSELRQGVVRRTVRVAGQDTVKVLELAHGCVSCTLRTDLLPLLCTLAARASVQRIVLELDPACEAEAVCHAIAEVVVAGIVGRIDGPAAQEVRIAAVLTCLDVDRWLDDATSEDTLAEHGLAVFDDERTIAQIAVGQVDFADALIVSSAGESAPWDQQRVAAVLARLVPDAPTCWVSVGAQPQPDELETLLTRIPASSRRGRVFDAHAPLLRGQPSLDTDQGVTLIEFAAERPFHPERLHVALDVLLEGVVSARGRLWLATQPDEVVWLESAGGGLRVGGAGQWLAAMDPAEIAGVDPERRAMASLRWDDRFGDRDVSLVIVAHDADPADIRHALHWALVDDEEFLLVDHAPEQVAQWEDPFGTWHTDPCATQESANAPIRGDRERGE